MSSNQLKRKLSNDSAPKTPPKRAKLKHIISSTHNLSNNISKKNDSLTVAVLNEAYEEIKSVKFDSLNPSIHDISSTTGSMHFVKHVYDEVTKLTGLIGLFFLVSVSHAALKHANKGELSKFRKKLEETTGMTTSESSKACNRGCSIKKLICSGTTWTLLKKIGVTFLDENNKDLSSCSAEHTTTTAVWIKLRELKSEAKKNKIIEATPKSIMEEVNKKIQEKNKMDEIEKQKNEEKNEEENDKDVKDYDTTLQIGSPQVNDNSSVKKNEVIEELELVSKKAARNIGDDESTEKLLDFEEKLIKIQETATELGKDIVHPKLWGIIFDESINNSEASEDQEDDEELVNVMQKMSID